MHTSLNSDHTSCRKTSIVHCRQQIIFFQIITKIPSWPFPDSLSSDIDSVKPMKDYSNRNLKDVLMSIIKVWVMMYHWCQIFYIITTIWNFESTRPSCAPKNVLCMYTMSFCSVWNSSSDIVLKKHPYWMYVKLYVAGDGKTLINIKH